MFVWLAGWVVMVGAVWAGSFNAQQRQAAATKPSHFRTDSFVFIAISCPFRTQGGLVSLSKSDDGGITYIFGRRVKGKKLKR
jgi:hypothetical protein